MDSDDQCVEWAYFTDAGPWGSGAGADAAGAPRRALCNAELAKDLTQLTVVKSQPELLRAHLVMCPHVPNTVLRAVCGAGASPPPDHPASDASSSSSSDDDGGDGDGDGDSAEVVAVRGPSGAADDDGDVVVVVSNSIDDADLLAPVSVIFTAPRAVALAPLPLMSSVTLPPGKVLVRAEVSAVSAGTEMLVYRGRMPPDIPTDAVLAGASGEQASTPFAYPATFGYASVGTVVAAGASIKRNSTGGKRQRHSAEAALKPGMRVFAFREHASWYVEDAASVMRVPDGIDPADAAFLPNVETAVSLAMDANPLPGENVVVVGQGIVGLLLVTVLKLSYGMSNVIAVDTLEDRLIVSHSCAGADRVVRIYPDEDVDTQFEQTLRRVLPPEDQGGADVSIDVSGTGEGLDTAIRATRDGGRVVIGSWFGSREVTLGCLGGRFHRSHISLVSSQVSSIPSQLTSRWDKARRFRLSWAALRRIAPSTRFPIQPIPIKEAVRAYEEVDRGEHLQVIFKY